MKISLICTILNEELTIKNFLHSIVTQSKNPDEVIIVDGGSTDGTLSIISSFKSQISNKRMQLKVLQKRGNRSVGRNQAIRHASGDVIVCTDAGNILDSKWVEEITRPFQDNAVDVVAGYYKGLGKSMLQKCLVPYALVMPDRINPNNFLPATRSMAFRKSVWKTLGGFPEQFSHNEDYVFARSIQETGFTIQFQKTAIVYWIPPDSFRKAYRMFWRFAYGDADAGIYRPKVLLIFLRYGILFLLFLAAIFFHSLPLLFTIMFLLITYIIWSIMKNFRYVRQSQAVIILPFLQIISDIAVLSGTSRGFIKRFKNLRF